MQIFGLGLCVVIVIDYSLVFFQMKSGYTQIVVLQLTGVQANNLYTGVQFGTGNVMFVGFSNKM